MSKKIYLDYQATTPVDPQILKKMMPYFNENFGNEIANIFDVEKVFSYGNISSKLKSMLIEFGAINFFIIKSK